jgi:hypothetical protein
MKLLELYIEGQRMNYRERQGFPLSLTMSIADAEDPSKVSGTHSKRSVSLPGDSETERLFEQFATAGRQNPGASRQKPARIEVNGLPIFVGVAQLDEATAAGAKYGRTANEYKVGLLGNNASWFDLIKDKKIKDLGLIPEHDLTLSVIYTNDSADPEADDWGYCLIRTRDWLTPGEVKPTELTPFLFIRRAIQKAFAGSGYTVHSDFFNTLFFKRLILPAPFRPLSQDVLNGFAFWAQDSNNTTALNSSTATHITLAGDALLNNPGGHYNMATGYYTVPHSGNYKITLLDKPYVAYIAALNNSSVAFQSSGSSLATNLPVTDVVFLEKNDVIDLKAISFIPPTAGFCYLGIEPVFDFSEGETIDFALYGNPDWLMGDMVLGLTQAFGLVWDTDPDAYTVRVEPRDRYQTVVSGEVITNGGFYHQTDRDDLTHRVDLSKEAEAKSLSNTKERFDLAWQTDGGDANQEPLETGDEVKFLNARYNFPTGRFQSGTTENENKFFAKTVHLLAEDIKDDFSDIIPQIPLMQGQPFGEEQTERGDFAPRLLYFAGRRGGIDGYVKLADGGGAYDFPAAFMVNYNDPDGFDPSLSFNTERLRSNVTVPGLLQRFHLQHLKRLEVGKQITEYLRWNEVDVLNRNFRRKVLLYDELYLLQAINAYKPLRDDTTETVLLLDAVPEPADVNKISGTTTRAYLPKNA